MTLSALNGSRIIKKRTIEKLFLIIFPIGCVLVCAPAPAQLQGYGQLQPGQTANPNLYNPHINGPSGQNPIQRRESLGKRYRLLIQNARTAIVNGSPQNALNLLAEAAAINPRSPEVYFWKGLALDKLGDHKDAVKSYADSLKLAKLNGMDSAELRINLGNTLVKLGYLNEALFDFQRAIEIDPKNGMAHLMLGRLYLDKTDYNLALDQFRRCEELHYQDSYLPYLKSLALAGLKRYEDARAELRPLLTSFSKSGTPHLFRMASSLNAELENP